jgi:serine/threonine protein kinase/tetratricopeptide (TPR) repeat protein
MGDRPPGTQTWIDALASPFDRAWWSGLRPRIEEYLAGVEKSRRPLLLGELLRVELEYRRKAGEAPALEEYQRRFAGYPEVVQAAFAAPETVSFRRSPTADPIPSGQRVAAQDTGEADEEATLSYSVLKEDGQIEPLLAPEHHHVLEATFRPRVLVQDRYRIEQELGRGGMGRVYLARDTRLDRPVAIKVSLLLGRDRIMNREHIEELRQSFAEEARLGANLTHPAIATVYDYGFHDNKPFTVFEYLHGQTLGELRSTRGRLTLEEMRLIIGPLAQALDFAHGRHVVHRDLKPENIRSTEQGLFKILDLGLAKEFLRDVDWSGFAGTPAYAAPEQAGGKACDGRTDQYALALIAFELLAGRRLFESRDRRVLLELHRDAPPTGIDEFLPDVPAVIHQALARALSKDPNDRFATCSDFAVALGCQLLRTPEPVPEILMEADVERMAVGRFGWRLSLGYGAGVELNPILERAKRWLLRRSNSVRLVLTRDRLWAFYRTEIQDWSFEQIRQVEPRVGPPTAETAQAESVRRAHLGTEVQVTILRDLHYWAAFLAVVVLIAVTHGAVLSGLSRNCILGLSLSTGTAIALVSVGRGLSRFRPWARRAAIVAGSATLFVVIIDLVAASALLPIRRMWLLPVRLSTFPLLVLVGYGLIVLQTRKGRFIFSAPYQQAVQRTHHLNLPPVGWNWTGLFYWNHLASLRMLRMIVDQGKASRQIVSFRFESRYECRSWAGALEGGRAAFPSCPTTDEPGDFSSKAVVLLRGRPQMRYQLLGSVEAKAGTRRAARFGLQVRAAMIGADAVIDLHEERLHEYHRTVRRLGGTAVKAVDLAGRFEFRSRVYAERVAWISNLALGLVVISFLVNVLELEGETASEAALFVATLHAVPLGTAVLARVIRWPQLIRPMAVTLLFLAIYQLQILWWQVPLALTLLSFSMFLSRAAWQAGSDFRRLIPRAMQRSPAPRAAAGLLAWVVAFGFAVVPTGWIIGLWQFPLVGQSRIARAFDRKVAAAEEQSRTAASNELTSPQTALVAWQRAVDQWEEVVRGSPFEPSYRVNLAIAYGNLGIALRDQGKLAEAITAFRDAIRITPDNPTAHQNLGYILHRQGKLDEAVAAYRQAIRLKPDDAVTHCNLGYALHAQGKKAEAIAAYRKAIDLKPAQAETHASLADALRSQGEFAAAVAEFYKARDLAKADPNLAQWIGHNLAATQRQAALVERLPAVLRGRDKPKDAAEGLDFAGCCYYTRRFADSALLYAQAFLEAPDLAADVSAGSRYNAACAAALAAADEGEQKPPLDTSAKARWRKQAPEWLKADLAAWAKIVQDEPPPARQRIQPTLRHWMVDADLAGIRDESDLKTLPEENQRACRALWAEVGALLAKARAGTSP